MKINIELNTKDIANAKQESITMITTALQAIAQADEVAPAVVTPEPAIIKAVEDPKPVKTETPQPKKAAAKKTETEKPEETKQEETVQEEKPVEKPEETTQEEEAVQTDTPAVDRQAVQNRLKEIAKAGKAKGIKEILTKRNVRKFSELPDDELADVLKEAEAL